MAPKTKVVLVGLGRMGRNHMRVLGAMPELDLVAVVDSQVPAPAELGRARFLRDTGELGSLAFDAAIIATPTGTHYDIARELTAMGKHLLVEKPIASTFAQGKDILRRAQQTGTRLVVGHVERFNPAVRRLRELVRAGALGAPLHFAFTRVGGCPETLTGNNVILDLAVHDIDVLRSFVGPVKLERSRCRVTWRDGVADTASIVLGSGSGATASVHVDWSATAKVRTIRVTGTRGVCFVDYLRQTCELVGRSAPEPLEDRTEPLRAQAQQFRTFLATGEVGDLCTGKDALAAVLLAEHAIEVERDRTRSRPALSLEPPPAAADEWV
jgi:UDP-N-acetylglucosamine 3-dehydrogenase